MPPSPASDDTPAWIKGDLPRDLPEPEAAPAIDEKNSLGTNNLAELAALSAAAGETEAPAQPTSGPSPESLEAELADRLDDLDSVFNDADEVPGTPGVAEIDEDLDDELDAAEDDGLPPTASADEPMHAPGAKAGEADIADLLAELDSALNDADELPWTPGVAEIDEDLEDELDATEDVAVADDTNEDDDEDNELVDEETADDEDDDDQDDEDNVGDEDEDEDVEQVGSREVDEAEEGDDQGDEDEDYDDEDDDDDNDDDGLDLDEEVAAADLETVDVDEVLIVELDVARVDGAEVEPAGETGLPEGAFLAELAEADDSPPLNEAVIEPEEAPAFDMTGRAEAGRVEVLLDGGEPVRGPRQADERPVAPASVAEALPPIEPPVVEDLSLEAQIESLLFVADGAVPVARLAEALEVQVREVEAALSSLAEGYRKRGLSVQRFREKVQLTTSPSAAVKVERFLGLAAATPLSRAALEALAIVAYQQPVTRPQIEAVRGVNSDSVIKNLLTKGLIEESGRAEGPGRPVLYSTTPEFMQHFGLTSLAELPPLSLPNAESLLKPAHVLKG